ncbi:hypothetical protein KY284_036365 [Solanum tuberosum]|nr:hypothetical protein KY284_036365 [Solanum tuberosum]
MVESHTKGYKKRYGTRSAMQKVMGSAIAANVIQTERARKRRREGHLPKEPTSIPLSVWSSDTDSDDVVAYVAKRRKEVEKASKSDTEQSKQTKVPGPHVQKPEEEKELTREARITVMENQKDHLFKPPAPYLHEPELHKFFYMMEVLNNGGIRTTVNDVKNFLDEETLGIILSVPMKGIRFIEGCKPSSEFTKHTTKKGDIKRAGLPKKFLKGEYQLFFEIINKALVPRT